MRSTFQADRIQAIGPRIALAASLCLLLASGTAKATLNATMDIQPRALQVGEIATLGITVRGVDNPSAPSLPPIDGVQVQMAGTERSMSFGTGGSDNSTTFRYRLMPIKEGTITVGPLAYTVQGETVMLPAVELQVVANGNQAAAGSAPTSDQVLFARLSVSPTNLYSQQHFDVYLTLYSRGVNLSDEISLMNMPAAGLRLQPFSTLQPGREIHNGQVFDVRRFRTKAQALTAGYFKLAPTLRVGVIVQQRRPSSDPFGDPFNHPFFTDAFFGRVRTQAVDIQPEPVELRIQDLPQSGQPTNFTGAVGAFSFDVQVRPREVTAGEPVTLTMQIVGEGNLDSISAPPFPSGDLFKTYDARLAEKEIDPEQAAGRKTFEQVIIPRSDGATQVPALTFSFFNPAKGEYKSITQGPYPLTVRASSNTAAKLVLSSSQPAPAPLVMLGRDIVYLKPAPAVWPLLDAKPWYRRSFFIALQALPPLLVLAFFQRSRRRLRLETDVAWARRQRAPRAARNALARAETAMHESNHGAFFEAVSEAIASYFGNRLNLSPGAVTGEEVLAALTKARAPAELLAEAAELIAQCEQVRFGRGGDSAANLPNILRQASRILRSTERVKL